MTRTAPAAPAFVYVACTATSGTADAVADSRSPDVWELADPVFSRISLEMSPAWIASLLQDLRQEAAEEEAYMEDEEEAPDALEVHTDGWQQPEDPRKGYGRQTWEIRKPGADADASPLAVLVVCRVPLS